MVWRRPGDKPLSEPMMVSLQTHIYVTRPQWVNGSPTNNNTPQITTSKKYLVLTGGQNRPTGVISICMWLIEIICNFLAYMAEHLLPLNLFCQLQFRQLSHFFYESFCYRHFHKITCTLSYDDFIKWKHFSRYWPFVRGIHRSPVNSPHKGQWRGALMFFLICARINGWVNNRETGDLTRHRAYYDDIVMLHAHCCQLSTTGILSPVYPDSRCLPEAAAVEVRREWVITPCMYLRIHALTPMLRELISC